LSKIYITGKGPLKGEIETPSDKSISHRAVIFASLAEGESRIKNFLYAEDPLSTLNAFKQMGVDITSSPEAQNNELIIHGTGLKGLKKPDGVIDCGNSGTTMRLLSGVLTGQSFSATLTGDIFLLRRPMKRIITPLTEMGAEISSDHDGLPPLNIKGGKLVPIQYESPIASAQVKSAILLAGLYCNGTTSVTEPGRSRDHTERMLKACGADISVNELTVSINGPAALRPSDLTIPGDLSSAAFFMVGALIIPGSDILIKNTGINPTRSGIIDILKEMGADITLENEREVSGEPVADIHIKHSKLSGIHINGDTVLRAIDEFPAICVAAAKAEGITKITGAGELRVKESDRISAMTNELRKMGVSVKELTDGLLIEGTEDLLPTSVKSYGDHRIAMSMIIAGMTVKGETLIDDTDCVNTSFPGFMELLGELTV